MATKAIQHKAAVHHKTMRKNARKGAVNSNMNSKIDQDEAEWLSYLFILIAALVVGFGLYSWYTNYYDVSAHYTMPGLTAGRTTSGSAY